MRIHSTVAVLMLALGSSCVQGADDGPSAEDIGSALLNTQVTQHNMPADGRALKRYARPTHRTALRLYGAFTAQRRRRLTPCYRHCATPAPSACCRRTMKQASPVSPGNRTAAVFDVALSSAATQFLLDLHFGRVDPRAAGFDLRSTRPPLDLGALLYQLASTDDTDKVIAAVEPQFYTTCCSSRRSPATGCLLPAQWPPPRRSSRRHRSSAACGRSSSRSSAGAGCRTSPVRRSSSTSRSSGCSLLTPSRIATQPCCKWT